MTQVQQVPLSFSSLSELDDGRIDRLMMMHIRRIAADCMDRPGDKNKRKVTLDFHVEPVIDDDGQCEYTKVQIECRSKVPTYRSKPYEMRVSKAGLLFNQDFPDSLDQPPLFQNPETESES